MWQICAKIVPTFRENWLFRTFCLSLDKISHRGKGERLTNFSWTHKKCEEEKCALQQPSDDPEHTTIYNIHHPLISIPIHKLNHFPNRLNGLKVPKTVFLVVSAHKISQECLRKPLCLGCNAQDWVWIWHPIICFYFLPGHRRAIQSHLYAYNQYAAWMCNLAFSAPLFYAQQLCVDVMWRFLLAHGAGVGVYFRTTFGALANGIRMDCTSYCAHIVWCCAWCLWNRGA